MERDINDIKKAIKAHEDRMRYGRKLERMAIKNDINLDNIKQLSKWIREKGIYISP